MGFTTSAMTKLVKNKFQPPSFGDFWLARRETTVCQSVACRSTLKPASRSNCAATIGCALNSQDIAGRHDHDGRAVVTGFGKQLLRFRHAVAFHQRFRSDVGGQRRVAAENRAAYLVVLGLPTSASSTSFWFSARNAARRTLTLSKGG